MAVKIVRQPKKIALIGAPTSAAALSAGHERAPSALRAAGLVTRLSEAGFQVTDLGDTITKTFQADDEHPRARNVGPLVAVLNDLRPRVEQAVKSGALPVIIGGDCSIALATVAGARRYYRHVDLVYVDRDADLNVPATTPSGCVDGMVISHMAGRGAPELVRFWGEPPLVRESDMVLFGITRLDAPEEAALKRSPIRHFSAEEIRRRGAADSARAAIRQLHSGQFEFVLHVDVDAISSSEFPAATFAAEGGLALAEVREALKVFAAEKSFAVLEITTYNPAMDADGSGAAKLIDLICEILQVRATAMEASAAAAASAAASATATPAAEAPTEKPSDAQGPIESPASVDTNVEAVTADSSSDRAADLSAGIELPPADSSQAAAASVESTATSSERESIEDPGPEESSAEENPVRDS
ncbi:MAG TPA: arginase family protein [Candidatus Acidoferrales bacterium]|nr:arginase family protein [Candidatus Acidoferrales bacterium]